MIVGAGLAGLATARALRQAGFTPELIERSSSWDVTGTGIYLPGNGVRALRALGLEDAVAIRAAHIRSQLLLDHRGRVLAEIDMRESWQNLGPCLALRRAELHQILREDVPVRLGRTIQTIEQPAGPVLVTFDDVSQAEFDLVIGADGLYSSIRRLTVDDRPPVPVGQQGWRFLASCPPETTTWTVMLGRGASFLTIPIGHGLAYCYADITDRRANHPHEDPLRRLRDHFAGFAAPVRELLEQLQDPARVHTAPIEQVAAEHWGDGAILLIGDAAHGMSPNMAEGGSLAFEDALVIAACLQAVDSVPDAVADFVARRAPRTGWVRAQTRRRDRTRNLPTALRNLTLRRLGPRIFQSNYQPLLRPI